MTHANYLPSAFLCLFLHYWGHTTDMPQLIYSLAVVGWGTNCAIRCCRDVNSGYAPQKEYQQQTKRFTNCECCLHQFHPTVAQWNTEFVRLTHGSHGEELLTGIIESLKHSPLNLPTQPSSSLTRESPLYQKWCTTYRCSTSFGFLILPRNHWMCPGSFLDCISVIGISPDPFSLKYEMFQLRRHGHASAQGNYKRN